MNIVLIFFLFTFHDGIIDMQVWKHPAPFGSISGCQEAGKAYLEQTSQHIKFECVDTGL